MSFLLFLCLSYISISVAIGYPPQNFGDGGGGIKNSFLQLAEQVANVYNLTNCWVCGGPMGLETWPWVSTPIAPKWLASNYSGINHTTHWEIENTSPWPIQYLVLFCFVSLLLTNLQLNFSWSGLQKYMLNSIFKDNTIKPMLSCIISLKLWTL